MPARPDSQRLISGSCSSARAFVSRFLQTVGRPSALALPFCCCDLLQGGLSPPSQCPCWAHTKEAPHKMCGASSMRIEPPRTTSDLCRFAPARYGSARPHGRGRSLHSSSLPRHARRGHDPARPYRLDPSRLESSRLDAQSWWSEVRPTPKRAQKRHRQPT
jgi:hypothetical protein